MPPSIAKKNIEIKVGILLGFTGRVEGLTQAMADSAELAFNEIAEYKDNLNEITFKTVRADTACDNINLAKSEADKLVNDGIKAIIGAACPNITINIAKRFPYQKF